MHRQQRHEILLRSVNDFGVLYTPRAMELTGASSATVRRDFEALSRTGAVERIHGGLRVIETFGNVPFGLREVQETAAKLRIARAAAALIRAGDTIFIDGGTTTYQLAKVLPAVPLHVVTNSQPLANRLLERQSGSDLKVYLTGGYLDRASGVLYGPGVIHGLGFYQANWAFLSVRGVDGDGFYNTSESIVEAERAMMERADRTVVLADATKLGQRGMYHLCRLEKVGRMITNAEVDCQTATSLKDRGLDIVHVA